MINEDTITAAATPAGYGAVSIIRLSGSSSIKIADSIFKGNKKISEVESHTVLYGKIHGKDDTCIDDVLVLVFRSPRSYTGEDSVEIHTHGNPYIVQAVLSELTEAGARLAEPGEFTKRAFLNGKIDLSQAEAVIDIIHAGTKASLSGARNRLNGVLSDAVEKLRSMLTHISSLLELELDFVEDGIELVPNSMISEKLIELNCELTRLAETYSYGKIINDGINVALAGAPNVGKSSLLNFILKEHRAIVSHLPGTTRDIIREDVTIDGIFYKISDTAGLRETADELEIEGVKRSRETIQQADVVIHLCDVRVPEDYYVREMLKKFTGEAKILTVFNKVDLLDSKPDDERICISAKTGIGIQAFFDSLRKTAFGNSSYTEQAAFVSNIRHFDCLTKAIAFVCAAKEALSDGLTGEFIANDLRSAESSLSEITGEITSEDILNNIFGNFCIGK